MGIEQLLQGIDAEAARQFVQATQNVLDAMLLESAKAGTQAEPEVRDYRNASLARGGPKGGWLSHEELRATTQKMAEAIAAEKWVDGMLVAIRLLTRVGG